MSMSTVASRPQHTRASISHWLVGAAVSAAIAGTAFSPPAMSAQEEELAEITVTGSRIVRRDLDASSPIVTVDAEIFERTSNVSVEGQLNKLPQFRADRTQFVASDVQASAFNTPGISNINLRGLGSNRNLVIIDGRRAQPANATLTVDVNSIPSAAIANVEIISGGASATYGADAIAGVVNFKLKRDFQGLVVDARSSITAEGDGQETAISALIGGNFGDGRGNVMVGVELTDRNAVLQKNRDFFVNGWNDPYTTGAGLTTLSSWNPAGGGGFPDQAVVDSVFGQTGVGATTNFYVNTDGSLFKVNPSLGYNSNIPGIKTVHTMVNGAPRDVLAEPERNGQISSPMQRYSIFARGTFDINDRVSAFVQGNLSEFDIDQILTYTPATSFWSVMVPRDADHPVPADLAALLDSRATPDAPWSFERILDYMGPRRSTNNSTVYQVLAGLEGRLGGDWTWEAYASHGETHTVNYLNGGFVSVERYRLLLSAPNYGAGFRRSDPSGGILGYEMTCTSGLPVFDSFTPSDDCIRSIEARMKNITTFEQDIIELNLQGGVLPLPAGELRSAVGASYRKNSVAFDPDVLNDQEGILDRPAGLFAANDASGSTSVKEVYAEFLVPVLAGLPAIRDLSLELGGRYSDYNIEGGLFTWKGLVNWKFTNGFSMRAGYQRANRAPNTAELYTGKTTTVAGFSYSDPCANNTRAPWGNVPTNPNRAQVQALCEALIGNTTSAFTAGGPSAFIGGNGGFFPLELELRRGNENLKSEKARTITAGLVFRSPFQTPALANLTTSVDWYDISIKDAISPLLSTTVYEYCFNANGSSNPNYSVNDPGGYCSLIYRDPVTGGRATVDAPYSNLGQLKTSGVDLNISWRSMLSDMGMGLPGALSANLSVNYLLEFKRQDVPGAVFTDYKGTLGQNGQYDWTSNFDIGYSLGNWGLNLTWLHRSAIENATYATTPTTTLQGAGAYDYFSLQASWQVNQTLSLRVGVENLLDKDPMVVGRDPGINEANGTTMGPYDQLGRRFFAGVKLNF